MPINTSDSMISLDSALDARLRSSGDIMNWCSGEIWEKQAISNDVDNYILWDCMAGGDENTGQIDSAKTLYLILAVSSSKLQAMEGHSLIQDCISTNSLTGEYWHIPGWHIYWVSPGKWFKDLMNVQGIQYWAIGKYYEIRFDRIT